MASSSGSSYASSEERTNYARMCDIVVHVFRDILWQVLTHEILSADLPKKVQTDIQKLKTLNWEIKTWLCGISPPSTEIPSPEKFDVSSLYCLIRNLCNQVPTPSKSWGKFPCAGDIRLGDDIERVREFRNTIYGHAKKTKIETAEFNNLCTEMKKVVKRFDAWLCSKGMKHDFECDIGTICTCPMDKSYEDDCIKKMERMTYLDGLVDVQQDLGDLKKTAYNVEDVMHVLQKDVKEIKKDIKNRSCRACDMEKEKDKVEDTAHSSDNEERDSNENAGISHEDIEFEMPQGMDVKICIIKCYADLKRELEKDIMMEIAKDLFQKEKCQDVLEEIDKAGGRRHCIDQFLKRVLKLEASGLKIFFDLLKRKCPERAQKLAKIKVTDKDREDFTQVSESVQEVPHRIQKGLKFEQPDVEFFQRHFQDIPEEVDYRADFLLSQFYISICDHSQLIKDNDSVKKIHALLEKIQSCHFDSDSEVESVLETTLYQKWQSFRGDGSRQGLENQGIWHYLLEKIQNSVEYLIEHFVGFRIHFMQARRGSLIMKFVTLHDFDVKLLKPEAVKTKVWDMIKTLCPEYQDIFKEPVHLTIFLKPLSNTDSAEIHFYLETKTEKEEFSCMKLGSHDKQYIVEEMGPVSLTNWMFNTLQLDEDTKAKLVDLVSTKDMSRRNKMKILLNIVESLGNGYELLEKYCEEHDTFLYNKVFKKHRQMMVQENPDGAQQYEFSEKGLQRLSSTWIDFTVNPTGKEEDRTCSVEKDDLSDIKQQDADLMKKGDNVQDVIYDVPKEKDKLEDVSESLIDEKHARQLEKEHGARQGSYSVPGHFEWQWHRQLDFEFGRQRLRQRQFERQRLRQRQLEFGQLEFERQRLRQRLEQKNRRQTVLNRCLPTFQRDLDINAVFQFLFEQKLFDDLTLRNISELKTTEDKVFQLIQKLKQTDQDTYRKFKYCLVLSKQEHLKDILEEEEINIATRKDSSLPPILPDNKPTERQLGRISIKIGYKSVVLGQALGLSEADIQHIQKGYPHTATQCLMICFKWMLQSGEKATFRNLEKAFKHADIDADILRSVNKAVDIESCLPPDMLDLQPEDKHLSQISTRIETEHVHLGVELKVPLSRIEQILAENLIDVHKQCFEIMKEWKKRKLMSATFRSLEKAFIYVGINPDILKQSLK